MGMDAKLQLLKADLGLMRVSAEQAAYLTALLTQSAAELERKGIVLTDTIEDDILVEMVAAWKYRVRAQSASPAMPETLRRAIYDRIVQTVAGGDGNG